ncbi:MAG: hypothetical protein JJV96_01770 [Alphaproteobacteria bacterium]|nr:hypothetical protein [Alphaproteobacteria bacterium]
MLNKQNSNDYIAVLQSEKISSGSADNSANNSALLAEHNSLSERLSQQEAQLRQVQTEKASLQVAVDDLTKDKIQLENRVKVSGHVTIKVKCTIKTGTKIVMYIKGENICKKLGI